MTDDEPEATVASLRSHLDSLEAGAHRPGRRYATATLADIKPIGGAQIMIDALIERTDGDTA